jgi:hypothetical protein
LKSKDLNEKSHAIKAKNFLAQLVLDKILWIQIKTQDKYYMKIKKLSKNLKKTRK